MRYSSKRKHETTLSLISFETSKYHLKDCICTHLNTSILHSMVLDHIGLVDMWVYDFHADSHRDLLPRLSVKHSLKTELGRLLYAEVQQKLVLQDFGSVG